LSQELAGTHYFCIPEDSEMDTCEKSTRLPEIITTMHLKFILTPELTV